MIKKSKKNVEEEIIGTFYKKGLQKTTETEFKIEKLISKNKIKVELNLSNYAAKSDFKKAAGVNASKFVQEADLTSWKPHFDDFYIDSLKTILADLCNYIVL